MYYHVRNFYHFELLMNLSFDHRGVFPSAQAQASSPRICQCRMRKMKMKRLLWLGLVTLRVWEVPPHHLCFWHMIQRLKDVLVCLISCCYRQDTWRCVDAQLFFWSPQQAPEIPSGRGVSFSTAGGPEKRPQKPDGFGQFLGWKLKMLQKLQIRRVCSTCSTQVGFWTDTNR